MSRIAASTFFSLLLAVAPVPSQAKNETPCPNRILQVAGVRYLAEGKLAAIRKRLSMLTLPPDERAENNFLAAKIYWTMGPQAFGATIRSYLDEALRVEPLHFEARMLSVNLYLFEDSLGLDAVAIESALSHIRELMIFPAVIANTELYDLLLEQKRVFEKRLRRSGWRVPEAESLDPSEEIRSTENLIWDIAGLAEKFSTEPGFQAYLDEEALREMVERFGRRVVAFFLEERPVHGVMEYSRLVNVLYYQTKRLPADLRVSLMNVALGLAEEFSGLAETARYGALRGWCFQVSKQLRQSKLSLSTLSWVDLFIAGHLSTGEIRADFWQGAYSHFMSDQAFDGSGDFYFLDRIILRHLKRLAEET